MAETGDLERAAPAIKGSRRNVFIEDGRGGV